MLIGFLVISNLYMYHKTYKYEQNKSFLIDETCRIQIEYKKACLKLFYDLRNPDQSAFHKPPLRKPPDHLYNEFTQNGEMPITKYWYFDEAYSDASEKKSDQIETIPKAAIDHFRLNGTTRVENVYYDRYMNRLMSKYSNSIDRKKMIVIGTRSVWLEAIALDAGVSKVITLDYTRKKYEEKDILEWIHVNDYLDYLIENKKIEEIDNAASFSSIEHSGLGRYGDPLDPNGDIKAVQQVHCMIKPGGLFFLGLPSSDDNSSFIEFNAHRVYGTKRLKKLLVGWDFLEQTDNKPWHSVLVLKKKSIDC